MIDPQTYADHALLAGDHPNIIVQNATAHVQIVDNKTLVAIAPTNDFRDAWADIKAIPWRPADLGVWVHLGMWQYTKKLIPLVMREIYINNLPVALTGHSLGGQAAYMLAALCKVRGVEVDSIYTFGCPKGGFKGYNKLTCDIKGHRYVRDRDQVADVPFVLGWSHDRPATILKGAKGPIDHPMMGYKSVL